VSDKGLSYLSFNKDEGLKATQMLKIVIHYFQVFRLRQVMLQNFHSYGKENPLNAMDCLN